LPRPVVPDDHVAVFSERQVSAADCLPQFARDGLQLGQLKLGGGIAVRRCGRRQPVAVESCEQPAEQVGLEVLSLYADFAASAEINPYGTLSFDVASVLKRPRRPLRSV
jgi:hypothetical protein